MIYVTGDTHGNFSRLSNKNWKQGKELNKEDYVIVMGDFGLIFNPVMTKDELYWIKWLDGRPWTTLFIDGNHDNHPKLNELPRDLKFGAEVGIVSDSIFHLRRGEIYTIEGKTFLAFGGAASTDQGSRRMGISWWPDEVPNYTEMDHCTKSIEKHGYKVDVILSHTCPDSIAPIIAGYRGIHSYEDPTQMMLHHIITTCEFDHYFCGHFHINMDYDKYHFLYERIANLDEVIERYNNERANKHKLPDYKYQGTD